MAIATFLRSHKKLLITTLILAVVAVLILAAIILVYVVEVEEEVHKGAIVTNGYGCSKIGISILEKGGNAVDAAIASLFCEGRQLGKSWFLNAREVAPAAATQDMFHGDSNLSLIGGLSVAVPAELKGYWSAYQKLGGGVPWKDLIQPSLDLCKNGILVTSFIAGVLEGAKDDLYADPVLRESFINPKTNDTYKEGQHYTRLKLAKTLEIIAEEGGDALHNGSLTEAFVKDIQNNGGIITVEDIKGYRPEWRAPLTVATFEDQTIYSATLPASGAILTFILNILDGFLDLSNPFSLTNYQRIVESFKFAYAKRTELGDEKFQPNISELIGNLTSKKYGQDVQKLIFDNKTFQDGSYYGASKAVVQDHGTANIAVLSPSGDAVAVTSTINYIFGAKFASNSTGIILNDQMDDFSSPNITNIYGVPPSPSNFIAPGKMPLSSMSPTVIVDNDGDVLMVVGAAGGSKITTSVAQVLINHLWFGLDLKSASDRKRIHHQLYPMRVDFESDFRHEDTYVPDGLKGIGHEIFYSDEDGFAAVTAITTNNGKSIVAVSDKRRPGSVSYL
ncbi:hypothetical protein JTB14_031886 [Gonioctena quinquepunctata]|nr:hypothetical protein JTB14_031886 [Gonioctena quinquepunctata]